MDWTGFDRNTKPNPFRCFRWRGKFIHPPEKVHLGPSATRPGGKISSCGRFQGYFMPFTPSASVGVARP